MLILPYRVDGPVDHRPWGTGAIIAANVREAKAAPEAAARAASRTSGLELE